MVVWEHSIKATATTSILAFTLAGKQLLIIPRQLNENTNS